MGILKQLISAAGFTPELHYLNFALAARIGLKTYGDIAGGGVFYPEWLFSQLLFGSNGTGEMRNRLDEMLADQTAGPMVKPLTGDSVESIEYFKHLAEVELPRFLDAAFHQVDWQRYKIVGFTTTFAQSLSSLAIAKRIKEAHPEIVIVFGGANVDSEMGNEFVRAFPWIDHAVHGEAEYTFPELLKAISSGEKPICIPGISSRNGDTIYDGHQNAAALVDINHSPVPDYTDYVASIEANGFKGAFKLQLFYESSRGCWWGTKHHCTFCGLNGGTMAFRQKDPDRVLQEVLNLSRDYSCLSLAATDNILPNQYWTSFLPQLASQDLDLGLFYEVKANLSFEQLSLLKSAGVREIQPGIESFSTRVLKLMNKGITGIQNVQLLKWCFELGIRPAWNILYGFPGETDEDYAEMPGLIQSISHLYPPMQTPVVMYERFSPYHFDSATYGLSLLPAREYEYIFPKQRVSFERIAYFFEDKDQRNSEAAKARFQSVLSEVTLWKNSWDKQERYCFYEKGPGFLLIYDNRPRGAEKPQEARLMKLGGQIADVYMFCNSIRAKRTIIDKFGDGDNAGTQRNRSLINALDTLVVQGLLHAEGDRYIALAVSKKSLHFWPDKY